MESYLTYLLVRSALGIVAYMPRAAAIRMLDLLALLSYRLDTFHRRIARVNLTIAFPDLSRREHDEIARKSFQNTARNLLEVSRMSRLTPRNIGRLVQYDPQSGLENFERARGQDKGILYLTGHFSAWELLPTAHALHGHPLSFVTRPLDNCALEQYLRRARESAGNKVIYKRNSARQILERLKAKEAVGILMDQNTSLQEGIFAEFFGLPAATSTSIALLALRTEAPVLPGYLVPVPEGRYMIRFLPPVDLKRTGDTSRDVEANTVQFNRILESIIRRDPEIWLWGHQRWRYQPEGTPPGLYEMSEKQLREFLSGTRACS